MTEPFLKWAGGKRWLVYSGLMRQPKKYERFIEPFLGGGAVFFHMNPPAALLSDINPDLIELYKVMRDAPAQLQGLMNEHQERHDEIYYYGVRGEKPDTEISRAARFLYLNRTCWNGLYRVNLRGQFNVPKGTKDTVVFGGEDFASFAKALEGAELLCSDFEPVINRAGAGDFLFVDPPYTVKHNVNGFIKYNEQLFSWEDQVRLRDAVARACARGAAVVMTNADHQSVRDLYSDVLAYSAVERHSVLAGEASRRGKTTEAFFTHNI
jgi:DNA adenine methylase